MLFSGIPFLYYFLPATVLLYIAAPKRLKNAVLLLASLFFYAWGEPIYVLLMSATITVAYVLTLVMERCESAGWKKALLILAVGLDLAALAYFKYADFFIANFNALTGLSLPLLRIALPIGISFYTFQVLSYTVDVYRGQVAAQRNIISLAAYVALFPQLIAGPIVRYSDIAAQLDERSHSFDMVAYGIRRFVLGLGKKVLIANALGELCSIFRASGDKSVLFFWLYAVAFMLHIYFDFSGYSDMAIGLGRMFGFEFRENFDHPYVSGSVTEFWRRWHMSLGSWFRDYVYIPLGGNRVSKARWFFNIFVVWMLTGFWHGAAWNFIIWGLYFAVLLVIEKLWLLEWLKKHKLLAHLYVLFTVLISFVIFNASDMAQAMRDIGGLVGIGGYSLISGETVYYLRSYGLTIVIAAVGSTPFVAGAVSKLARKPKCEKVLNALEPVALVLILLLCTAYLVDGSFNPFLYFRF